MLALGGKNKSVILANAVQDSYWRLSLVKTRGMEEEHVQERVRMQEDWLAAFWLAAPLTVFSTQGCLFARSDARLNNWTKSGGLWIGVYWWLKRLFKRLLGFQRWIAINSLVSGRGVGAGCDAGGFEEEGFGSLVLQEDGSFTEGKGAVGDWSSCLNWAKVYGTLRKIYVREEEDYAGEGKVNGESRVCWGIYRLLWIVKAGTKTWSASTVVVATY